MSFRGFLAILILVAVLGGGFWIYTLANSQWIEAGYVGVVYSPTQGLQSSVLKPGRHWVPPYHQLYTYPTMEKAAIYTQDDSVGEERAADGVQVTTSDNANTTYDVAVFYRVRPEDVLTAFKEFGAHDIEYIQANHIRRAVREATNAVGPRFDAFQMMGTARQQASTLLVTELRTRLGYKGITIEKAYFCQAFPSAQLQAKVNGQVNSLTELTISGIRADIAKQEKTAAITRARAHAQAAQLTAAQANPMAEEMLELDVAEAAAKNWKGHLAPVSAHAGQFINIPPGLLSAAAAPQEEEQPAPAAQTEESK
jgi:regulator of protease activity HflC (stomatin/prohibitin superfamily)